MATDKALAYRMERAFPSYELSFEPEEIHSFPVPGGTGYYVNRGEMEFSRGLIDAYVYLEYPNGESEAVRIDSEQELKLWTEHLSN